MNVKFFVTSDLNKYLTLAEKNPLALYFVTDEATGQNYLFKGSEMISAGHEATEQFGGLMSAADKAKLNALAVGGMIGFVVEDESITLTETDDGKQSIKVAISTQENNALVVTEDGLFVATPEDMSEVYATKEEITQMEEELTAKLEENLVWNEMTELE